MSRSGGGGFVRRQGGKLAGAAGRASGGPDRNEKIGFVLVLADQNHPDWPNLGSWEARA
mgnify:CR=1 FL=1